MRLTRQGLAGFTVGVVLTVAVVTIGDDIVEAVLPDEDLRTCAGPAMHAQVLFPTPEEAAIAAAPPGWNVVRVGADEIQSLARPRDPSTPITTVPPSDTPPSPARYGQSVAFKIEPPEGVDQETLYVVVQHRNVVHAWEDSIPVQSVVEPGWGLVGQQSALECLASWFQQ